MAPEMLLGQTYNEKSDVFSFAMCLIELVDGKLPWTDCCAPSAIPLKVSQGQVPMQQLTGLNSSYPQMMAELIQGCWASEGACCPTGLHRRGCGAGGDAAAGAGEEQQ